MIINLHQKSLAFFLNFDLSPIIVLNIHLNGIVDDGLYKYMKLHIQPYFSIPGDFVTMDIPYVFLQERDLAAYRCSLGTVLAEM